MNTAIIQPAAAETQSVSRHTKPKAEASGEFRDMLSGAMKAGGKTTETETAQTEKNAVRDTKGRGKQQRTDEADKTPEAEAVNAAAQVAQAAQAIQPEAEVQVQEPEAAGAEDPLLSVQQVQAAQIVEGQIIEATQGLPVQGAEEIAQPEAQQAPRSEAQTRQTETQSSLQNIPRAEEAPPETVKPQVPATSGAATRQDVSAGTQQEAPATTETAEIPDETAEDVVSARVVSETPELVPAERMRRIITPSDEDSEHFGEMLTKASKELGQGRTVAETAEDTEDPVTGSTDTVQDEPKAETVTDTDMEIETETSPRSAESTKETAPRFEQRPLKEMPKTDETVLGIIQPKPDVAVQDVERQEPVPQAQPVRIPDQAEQIRTRVIESLDEQKLEFEMQLNPRELGRVDVKMVLESGKLVMEIMAANPKSTELLSKQVDGLMASLRLTGVDVSSISVVTARQDVDGQMAQAGNPYNSENFQSQSGGGSGQGGHGRPGGTGGGDADYPETQADETRAGPQRLLNYSV